MFSFIVPVKNGLAYTRALVETVTAQNPEAGLEWIIVDSGSTDGTLEYCREIGARVVPFRSEPFNYCAAVNAGVAAASGTLWIISNNDIEWRSPGDLARIEGLFREWPLLAVLSPGRPTGAAELEFRRMDVYGASWVVRPEAFRAWGGMPEGMSGYGWDEVYTYYQCLRHGVGNARLTGWDIFHHGSVTFGSEAATITPALRRNFSRLLVALGSGDLDGPGSVDRLLSRLREREYEKAPLRLALLEAPGGKKWLERQGYENARPLAPHPRLNELRRAAKEGLSGTVLGLYRTLAEEPGLFPVDTLVVFGRPETAERRQWLPWLANEARLRPDAPVVGGDGWYAVRPRPGTALPDPPRVAEALKTLRVAGPAAPTLMPALAPPRPTLRQWLRALYYAWRHRHTHLPEKW